MNTSPPDMNQQKQPPLHNVWALAGELGFIIAVPLVVFVIVGVKADAHFNTTPLFIIAGMLLSAVISTISVARKIKRLTL
jgi:F0F1-type ATP synthase assembly protein I